MIMVLIVSMWLAAAPPQPAPYKNVQILGDVPADRLRATMDYVRASLGVQCWHCHVQGDLGSDAKPAKVRAREMMRMVRAGLLQRIETKNVTPLGSIGERLTFEDYRRVDGVLLPFRVTRADAQFQYVQRIDEIRHNVPVDDSLFRVPTEPAPPFQAADPKSDAAMRAITAALGVDCAFCHVPDDWKNESRDPFATARTMMEMVRVLNEGPLQGIGAVSCATCHGGQTRPSRLPIPLLDAERAKWPASLAGHADRSMGMSVYNVTLGVGCEHCHDPADWTSDAKAPFRTAVRMAAMFDLFPKYMPATARTQCWMCHKGSTKPR